MSEEVVYCFECEYFADEGEGKKEGGESGGAAAEELASTGAAETGDGGSERAGEPGTYGG